MKDKVVFTFGRMNPPTIGHAKLVDIVKREAGKRGADPHIYLSHSQDAKKNPLDYNTKIRLAQSAFGPSVKKTGHKTVIDILKMLSKRGVKEVVMVVGSDRVPEFDRILDKYNGKEYKFDSIRVISAGERDPDADGVSGMSASKLRGLAKSGDFDGFKTGMPSSLSNAEVKKVYNKIRSTIKEEIELDEAKFEVDIEGLPKMYIDAGSAAAVKTKLRKLLKKQDMVKSVERVTPADYKKSLIKRVLGQEDEEQAEMQEEKKDDLKKACWKGYRAVGLKKKGNRMVPNCVPEDTDFSDDELDMFVATLDMDVLDEEYFEELDNLEEALTPAQRIKRARIMRRMAPKIKRKREMLKKRLASPEKLNVRSRKAAVKLLRKRFAGKMGANYANLSPSQKSAVDRLIAKKMSSVGTISKRLLPKIRKAEMERLKAARSSKNEELRIGFEDYINQKFNEGAAMDAVKQSIEKEKTLDKRKWDLLKDRARTKDTKVQNRMTKETVTSLKDILELKTSTLKSYADKSSKDIDKKFAAHPDTEKDKQKLANRVRGWAKATNKLRDRGVEEHTNCGTPECCGQCDTASLNEGFTAGIPDTMFAKDFSEHQRVHAGFAYHPSVMENGGAGEEATDKLKKKYKDDTPGE